MSDIARVLKEEIQRLARRQVRAALGPIRRDTVRLKKLVVGLRREVVALSRANSQLVKKVAPVVAVKETEELTQKAATLRPTSKSIGRLRARLGLTQEQFGQLLGVSGQSVVQWAAKDGRIRLRRSTLSALAGIQGIGKREAWRRLEAMGVTRRVARRRRAR